MLATSRFAGHPPEGCSDGLGGLQGLGDVVEDGLSSAEVLCPGCDVAVAGDSAAPGKWLCSQKSAPGSVARASDPKTVEGRAAAVPLQVARAFLLGVVRPQRAMLLAPPCSIVGEPNGPEQLRARSAAPGPAAFGFLICHGQGRRGKPFTFLRGGVCLAPLCGY